MLLVAAVPVCEREGWLVGLAGIALGGSSETVPVCSMSLNSILCYIVLMHNLYV